jgi:hypothetical protein
VIRGRKKSAENRFEFVPGTSIPEPITGREEDYRPWEAPPTLSVDKSQEVAIHQADVHTMHFRLIQNLPPSVIDAVANHVIPQGGKGLKDYQGNHERSLMLLPELELDNDGLAIRRKVELGKASMPEIKEDFMRLGRGSAELASLRVIDGHRSEYIPEMMEGVREVVGEGFNPGEPRKFRIIGLDDQFLQGRPMDSITWGYKQYLGPDAEGNEYDSRHTFVLRTDSDDEFDPYIRMAMESAAQHDQSHIVHLKRVREVLDEMAATGPSHHWAAAATIKIYMFNRAIDEQIAQRDQALIAMRQNAEAFDSSKAFYVGPPNDY